MLALENRTPYAAERTIVMNKAGEKSWVVAVKATYHLRMDGKTELVEAQKPLLYSAEHIGEPGKSSILYAAPTSPQQSAGVTNRVKSTNAFWVRNTVRANSSDR